MQVVLKHSRPLALVLIIALIGLSMPKGHLEAAIVTTESALAPPAEGQADRERVRAFLNRAEVKAQLQAYGISPEEAIARVESLTDGEIALIAGKVDQLPAGGCYGCGEGAAVLLAAAIVVVVLIVVGLFRGAKWIFGKLVGSKQQQVEEYKADEPKVD